LGSMLVWRIFASPEAHATAASILKLAQLSQQEEGSANEKGKARSACRPQPGALGNVADSGGNAARYRQRRGRLVCRGDGRGACVGNGSAGRASSLPSSLVQRWRAPARLFKGPPGGQAACIEPRLRHR